KKVYLAVHGMDGTPVVVCVDNGNIRPIDLKNASFTSTQLNNPVPEDSKDEDGSSNRVWAISDMTFQDGQLLVTGLSTQEFGSTFRSIPYPFTGRQSQSSLEIFHAAHGRFETLAPIMSFTVGELGGKKQLIASYTCTPLVLFPLDELKPG